MELEQIKTILIDRVKKYDKDDIINPIDIQLCADIPTLLSVILKHKKDDCYNLAEDKYIDMLLKNNTLTVDLLVELFTEKTLNENYIYTTGNHRLSGSHTYHVFGNANVSVYHDSIVYAYNQAIVKTRQKATLIAYDEVTFTASDDSVVYCDSTIGVNGDFYERTQGLLSNVHGKIRAYANSKLTAIKCSQIEMYDKSTAEIRCGSKAKTLDKSQITCCYDSSVDAFDNSCIYAYGSSTVRMFNNSYGYFFDNSYCIADSANEITAKDNSIVEAGQYVKFINAYNYSTIKIKEMGAKLRAYDNSIIEDYADIYTNALNNAVIIWMNKHQIFKNQQKYSAEVPFDYTDEQKCQ